MSKTITILLIFLFAVGMAEKAAAITPTPTTTIYAAVRTDGLPGAGTLRNPYDASTEAKFDAILANILAGGGQRIILHLAAGVYTVTPVPVAPTQANPAGFGNNIPGNLEIIGAGENTTTIRAGIVPAGSATYWMFAQVGTMPGDEFENLTLDCNIQNQTAANLTIDGIECLHVAGAATHVLAANVHIIDGGNRPSDPGYSEWFGINLQAFQTGSVAEITRCRVDTYQGNAGCTALVANTLISGNVVILNNGDPDGLLGNGASGGFQDAFSPSETIVGNTCEQCTWGVYTDVDSQGNINIERNVLNALYGGVWIYIWDGSATITNISIHNNVIRKTYASAAILGTASTTPTSSKLLFYDNQVETILEPDLGGVYLLTLAGAQNCEAFGNTFTTTNGTQSLPTQIIAANCNMGTIAWFSNKLNGAVVPSPAGWLAKALSPAP